MLAEKSAIAPKIFTREHGVFLPLGALFIVILVGTLIGAVLNSFSARNGAVELRRRTDEICRLTAMYPGSPEEAYRYFSEQVTSLALGGFRYGQVTDASIVIPLMPADGTFPVIASDGEITGSAATRVTPTVASCSLPGTKRCDFLAEPPSGAKLPFPVLVNYVRSDAENSAFGSQYGQNENNTFICEMSAKVSTFFNGHQPISARSLWWRPVRGSFAKSSNPPEAEPGLTIAIGTEMTTYPDTRFSFAGQGQPVLSNFDPTFFDSGEPATFTGPQSAITTNRAGTTNQTVQAIAGVSGSAADDLRRACLNPLVLVRNTFTSTLVELAARNGQLRNRTEILHINPQHNRNREDVSLAPVSGNTTLDASIGTPSEGYPFAPATFGIPTPYPNHPTLMVPYGADLGAPNFQIPYVVYDAGAPTRPDGTIDPIMLPGYQGGWIEPFLPASAGSFQAKAGPVYSLIASQLRMCHHIYNQVGGGSALNRFGIPELASELPTLRVFASNSFYPNALDPDAFSLRSEGYNPGASDRWDQPPNASGAADTAWEDPLTSAKGLTAGQLVAVLGSTQRCPTSFSTSYPGRGGTTPLSCPVVNDLYVKEDLRPDLVGLAMYLSGDVSYLLGSGNTQFCLNPPVTLGAGIYKCPPFPAYTSPGLFRMSTYPFVNSELNPSPSPSPSPVPSSVNDLSLNTFPFSDTGGGGGNESAMAARAYRSQRIATAPVVIISHKLPTRGELLVLNQLFNVSNPAAPASSYFGSILRARTFTYVFFPENGDVDNDGNADVDNPESACQRIRALKSVLSLAGETNVRDVSMGISNNTALPTARQNRLFIFSPYSYQCFGLGANTVVRKAVYDVGDADDVMFQKYWLDLLGLGANTPSDAGEEPPIAYRASTLFHERILGSELRF